MLQRYGGNKVSYKCCAQVAIFYQLMLKNNSALQLELFGIIEHFHVIPIRRLIFSTNGMKISQNFANFPEIAKFAKILAVC